MRVVKVQNVGSISFHQFPVPVRLWKELGGALAVKEELIYSGYVNGRSLKYTLASVFSWFRYHLFGHFC